MGALVLAEVEDFEGAEVLALVLKRALYLDKAFAGGVNGELTEVGDDPLAVELFGDRGGGAGTAEEVGDDVVFVGAGFYDTFEKGFRFLGGVVDPLIRSISNSINISHKTDSALPPFVSSR